MLSTILQMGSMGVSFAKGIYDTVEGAKRERTASEALDNYKRQDLKNAYDGMAVPTLGIQLRTQEANRTAAGMTKQASMAGSRGVVGSSGAIADFTTKTMAQIGADFQNAEFALANAKAADESRIRSMQESRENMDITSLNAEISSARSQKRSAFDTFTATAASGAEVADGMENDLTNMFGGGAFGSNQVQDGNPKIKPSYDRPEQYDEVIKTTGSAETQNNRLFG